MKKIVEYFSIISVTLIFLGYWNIHIFYSDFQIPIYNYISTSEIVLSFLPSIITIIKVLFYCFIVLVYISWQQRNNKDAKNDDGETSLSQDIKWLSTSKGNKLSDIIGRAIVAVVKLLLYTYLFISLVEIVQCISLNDDRLYKNSNYAIMIVVIYFLSFNWINKIVDNCIKNVWGLNIGRYFFLLYALLGFFWFTMYNSKVAYVKIVNGDDQKRIEFKYENKLVKTNKKIVLIGTTKENIFLRNLQTNENHIYYIKNIDYIKIWDN